MPSRSPKLKNRILGLKQRVWPKTHVTNVGRGGYQDVIGTDGEGAADGQTNGDVEAAKIDDGQGKEVEVRVEEGTGRGTDTAGRGLEKQVARCASRMLRVGGYCEVMVGRAKEGDGKVKNGVVRFLIKGRWRQLPHEHWAWKPRPQRITYQRCQYASCDSPFDCSTQHHYQASCEHDYLDWIPELMYALGPTIEDSPKPVSPQSLSFPRDSRPDISALGAGVPPGLFPLLYEWDDEELARKCRLVCRYWDKQCRERAFTRIDLYDSEKKVLELVRFKYYPTWRHIPSFVEDIWKVPNYDDESTRPWLHLLDPRWHSCRITISGPFRRHRTIRSIHFTLPRSMPPSFSREIKWLRLYQVNFRHFEDTACLLSQLPDLEDLLVEKVTWELLPTQLPRRRPRSNRNKLRVVNVTDCEVREVESPSFLFPAFTLFPNVYSVLSFFSADIVTAVEAVLHLASSKSRAFEIEYRSEGKTDSHVGYISFGTRDGISVSESMLTVSCPIYGPTDNNNISIFINIDHKDVHFMDDNSDKWATLNTTISSLQRRIQCLFGFDDQAHIPRFVDVVNDKLPSLSTCGEVRYTVAKTEARNGDLRKRRYWYQAELESENLQGEGTDDPLKVYPKTAPASLASTPTAHSNVSTAPVAFARCADRVVCS